MKMKILDEHKRKKELIKELDFEIRSLTVSLATLNLADRYEAKAYNDALKRIQQLTQIRNDLKNSKDSLEYVKVGIMAGSVIAGIAVPVYLANYETKGDTIIGRMFAWKKVGTIKPMI